METCSSSQENGLSLTNSVEHKVSMLGFSEQEMQKSVESWDVQRNWQRELWTLSLQAPRDLGNLSRDVSVGMQPEVTLKVSTDVRSLTTPSI
jgi:hypothetical protein